VFERVAPTPDEVAAPMPGDDLVARADVTMDRAFTLAPPPEVVWPWLVQLGKRRAGWYLPRSVERLVPRGRRAVRRVEERWQRLAVGDVIPDYGGRDETFTVAAISPATSIVCTSQRGGADVSWSIALSPTSVGQTRVRLRLRVGPVKRPWLVEYGGGLFDLLTIAGLAAGLDERLAQAANERT
jgi:hypothetical protein